MCPPGRSPFGRRPAFRTLLTRLVVMRYHPPMTPDEVRRARRVVGLTQSAFAALLGVHVVTVKKWETGAQGVRGPAERLIRLLAAQPRAIAAMLSAVSRKTARKGR